TFRETSLRLGVVTFLDTRRPAAAEDSPVLDITQRKVLRLSGTASVTSSRESNSNTTTPGAASSEDLNARMETSLSYGVRRGLGLGLLLTHSWGHGHGVELDWRGRWHATGVGPIVTVFPFELCAATARLGKWHPYLGASHAIDRNAWTSQSTVQVNGASYMKSEDSGGTTTVSAGAIYMFSRRIGLDMALDRRWYHANAESIARYLPNDPLSTSSSTLHEHRWELRVGIATFLALH
ncbi:MAG TPA: hypothetical protein VKH19_08175, partial [Gemmatimonadaceae bacterium]|nr:hypothetical protein [Gemmatimonadaceae bacterium]